MKEKNLNCGKARIIITDDKLIHLNPGRLDDNNEAALFYKAFGRTLHKIDFEICAANYKGSHPLAEACVAETNAIDFSFTFYTSGLLVKVLFKKKFVFDHFRKRLLRGGRAERFEMLRHMVNASGYTTYDLS